MEDQNPLVRASVRNYPNGYSESTKPSIGRRAWHGVTKFVSVMGTMTKPFAEGWRIAGGPGGSAGIVVAQFMENFGALRSVGSKVGIKRAAGNIGEQAQTLNNMQTQVISTDVIGELGNYLSTRHDAISSNIDSGF